MEEETYINADIEVSTTIIKNSNVLCNDYIDFLDNSKDLYAKYNALLFNEQSLKNCYIQQEYSIIKLLSILINYATQDKLLVYKALQTLSNPEDADNLIKRLIDIDKIIKSSTGWVGNNLKITQK